MKIIYLSVSFNLTFLYFYSQNNVTCTDTFQTEEEQGKSSFCNIHNSNTLYIDTKRENPNFINLLMMQNADNMINRTIPIKPHFSYPFPYKNGLDDLSFFKTYNEYYGVESSSQNSNIFDSMFYNPLFNGLIPQPTLYPHIYSSFTMQRDQTILKLSDNILLNTDTINPTYFTTELQEISNKTPLFRENTDFTRFQDSYIAKNNENMNLFDTHEHGKAPYHFNVYRPDETRVNDIHIFNVKCLNTQRYPLATHKINMEKQLSGIVEKKNAARKCFSYLQYKLKHKYMIKRYFNLKNKYLKPKYEKMKAIDTYVTNEKYKNHKLYKTINKYNQFKTKDVINYSEKFKTKILIKEILDEYIDKFVEFQTYFTKLSYNNLTEILKETTLNRIITLSYFEINISAVYTAFPKSFNKYSSVNDIEILSKINSINEFIKTNSNDLAYNSGINDMNLKKVFEENNKLQPLLEQIYCIVTFYSDKRHTETSSKITDKQFLEFNEMFFIPHINISFLVYGVTSANHNFKEVQKFYQCCKVYRPFYITKGRFLCNICGLLYCHRRKLTPCVTHNREITTFFTSFDISLTLNTTYINSMHYTEDEKAENMKNIDYHNFINIIKTIRHLSRKVLQKETQLYKMWIEMKKIMIQKTSFKIVKHNLALFLSVMINQNICDKKIDYLDHNDNYFEDIINLNSKFLFKKLISMAGILIIKMHKKGEIDYFTKLLIIVSEPNCQNMQFKKKLLNSLLILFKSLIARKICTDYFLKIFDCYNRS